MVDDYDWWRAAGQEGDYSQPRPQGKKVFHLDLSRITENGARGSVQKAEANLVFQRHDEGKRDVDGGVVL